MKTNIEESERNLIALLDMDGTVADYEGQLSKDLSKLASPSEPSFDIWGDKRHPEYIRARMELIKCRGEWWENLPVLPIGMKIVSFLKEYGFSVHILTQGPKSNPEAWSHKARWVMKNLPETPITITRDKGLVYGRILVDDWPEYIERWLKWRPRGQVIMPAQKWNLNFSHQNVLRYDGTNDEELKLVLDRTRTRGITL